MASIALEKKDQDEGKPEEPQEVKEEKQDQGELKLRESWDAA